MEVVLDDAFGRLNTLISRLLEGVVIKLEVRSVLVCISSGVINIIMTVPVDCRRR